MLFLLGAAVLFIGCTERSGLPGGNHDAVRYALPDGYVSILEHADRFELLSLDPDQEAGGDADVFHDWVVLGRTELRSRQEQRAVVADVYGGILKGDMVAQCFEPRHGLHIERRGEAVDMVICFYCKDMNVYGPGMDRPWDPGSGRRGQAISQEWKPALNSILSRAGIPLAPEPPHP